MAPLRAHSQPVGERDRPPSHEMDPLAQALEQVLLQDLALELVQLQAHARARGHALERLAGAMWLEAGPPAELAEVVPR